MQPMPRMRVSDVWLGFNRPVKRINLDGTGFSDVECKICLKKLKYDSSTSTLRHHLSSHEKKGERAAKIKIIDEMDSNRVEERRNLIKSEKEENSLFTESSNRTEQLFDYDIMGVEFKVVADHASNITVKRENEKERGSQCGPWSRLRSPDDLKRSFPSEMVQGNYAPEARSLKKKLISMLTCDNESLDVESMVDLANPALESLGCLQGDFSDLFEKVSDFIKLRHELLEIKRELEKDGSVDDIKEQHTAIIATVNEARIRLDDTTSTLDVAEKDNEETKLSIKRLEKEWTRGVEKIAGLKMQRGKLGETYVALVNEKRDLEKKIDKRQEIAMRVTVQGDMAKAAFDRAKAKLLSTLS